MLIQFSIKNSYLFARSKMFEFLQQRNNLYVIGNRCLTNQTHNLNLVLKTNVRCEQGIKRTIQFENDLCNVWLIFNCSMNFNILFHKNFSNVGTKLVEILY